MTQLWKARLKNNLIWSYHTALAKHHLIYDVPDKNGCSNGAELLEPERSKQLP
jgi:hypothetical protein